MVGLLLRLGQDDRDRLAVPMDAVVLHDLQAAAPGRLGAGQEQGRGLHPRGIAVGHDEHDAGRGLGGARVKRGDAAAGDRAVVQRGVNHSLHHVLGGEAGLAPDLERPVHARHLRTDEAVLGADHRVGARVRGPALGGDRHRGSGLGTCSCPGLLG